MAFPPSTRLLLSLLLSRSLIGTLKLDENEKDDENEAEKDWASVGAVVPAATGAEEGAAVAAGGSVTTGADVGALVAATGAGVAAT
eukprot:CAMPEP_0181040940 /NCGR_PEP_ID=MMETSP1070-20121207/11331_1 /TAXON_ID=265543 /ORGANISM="Minutocellus polymorphus, Strain NH13" /LENGTH=85 /DNA_ID=CAMNT_0023119013 /DNA_START=147 /DNA_END=401 /DNA_ORIENTATION=-